MNMCCPRPCPPGAGVADIVAPVTNWATAKIMCCVHHYCHVACITSYLMGQGYDYNTALMMAQDIIRQQMGMMPGMPGMMPGPGMGGMMPGPGMGGPGMMPGPGMGGPGMPGMMPGPGMGGPGMGGPGFSGTPGAGGQEMPGLGGV